MSFKTAVRKSMDVLPLFAMLLALAPSVMYFSQVPVKFRGPASDEIARFAEVSPGIYRGAAPTSEADFEVLRENGIKTIIDLRTQKEANGVERGLAERYGIELVSTPVMGWVLPPSEESVNAALAKLEDPSLRPVFIHCELGRDRTSLIVALHRIHSEGWDKARANDEMKSYGFKDTWYLWGLRHYFEAHAERTGFAANGGLALPGQ